MADAKLSTLASTNPRGTPDRANDLLYIVKNGVQYAGTVNNELGISGNPVGDTDSQTLTNKTLTSPTISGPTLSGTLTGTYTLGGTPTFPASVVTLTGTQTLTNKTLTSPTISAPTITNASITADAITGFTSANTGTIYGIAITAGGLNGSSISAGTVGATQLSTSAIALASINSSTTQTGITSTPVLVTGLTTTVTVPSGGRRVRVEALLPYVFCTNIATVTVGLYNSATVTGSPIQTMPYLVAIAGTGTSMYIYYEYTPSPGSQSYCVGISTDTGTASITTLTTTRLNNLNVKVI